MKKTLPKVILLFLGVEVATLAVVDLAVMEILNITTFLIHVANSLMGKLIPQTMNLALAVKSITNSIIWYQAIVIAILNLSTSSLCSPCLLWCSFSDFKLITRYWWHSSCHFESYQYNYSWRLLCPWAPWYWLYIPLFLPFVFLMFPCFLHTKSLLSIYHSCKDNDFFFESSSISFLCLGLGHHEDERMSLVSTNFQPPLQILALR